MAIEGENSQIQSVTRAVRLLEAVAAAGPHGARLPELVSATGLNRASAHRLLKSLVALGMVDRDEAEARYYPGLKLYSIAVVATDRFRLATITANGCRRIAEATGDTVFVQLRNGRETVCVARHQGAYPIKTLTLDVGQRRPLGVGAGGLACLASEPDVQGILSGFEQQYRTFGLDGDQVRSELAATRQRGFALDAGGVLEGVTGVAVPLRRPDGRAIAALTVAAISTRMQGRHLEEVVVQLGAEAKLIEERLVPLGSSGTDPLEASVFVELH